MSVLEKKVSSQNITSDDVSKIAAGLKEKMAQTEAEQAKNLAEAEEHGNTVIEIAEDEKAEAEKAEKAKAKAKPLTAAEKLEKLQEQQKKLAERMQKARAEVQKAKDKANVGDWRVLTQGVLAMYDSGTLRDKFIESLKDRKLFSEDESKQFSDAMKRQLAIYREDKAAREKLSESA